MDKYSTLRIKSVRMHRGKMTPVAFHIVRILKHVETYWSEGSMNTTSCTQLFKWIPEEVRLPYELKQLIAYVSTNLWNLISFSIILKMLANYLLPEVWHLVYESNHRYLCRQFTYSTICSFSWYTVPLPSHLVLERLHFICHLVCFLDKGKKCFYFK